MKEYKLEFREDAEKEIIYFSDAEKHHATWASLDTALKDLGPTDIHNLGGGSPLSDNMPVRRTDKLSGQHVAVQGYEFADGYVIIDSTCIAPFERRLPQDAEKKARETPALSIFQAVLLGLQSEDGAGPKIKKVLEDAGFKIEYWCKKD